MIELIRLRYHWRKSLSEARFPPTSTSASRATPSRSLDVHNGLQRTIVKCLHDRDFRLLVVAHSREKSWSSSSYNRFELCPGHRSLEDR